MRSVTVRVRADEFSATMNEMAEWLAANRYEPARYKYHHHGDCVVVTVDFPVEVAAEAFAIRFDGDRGSSQQPAGSPDPHRS
jgi:hypothetical protein